MRRLVLAPGWLAEGRHPLPEAEAHYARDVLRLRLGAELTLHDGAGQTAQAVVAVLSRGEVVLDVGPLIQVPPPPPPAITLIQAVAKGDKMDAVVRQATELGVARIVPVLTERAVAHKEARLERWRTIAEDALRVSGRAYRPQIDPVQPLSDLLGQPRAGRALVLALEQGRDLAQVLGPSAGAPETLEVLIGPEGGLDPKELEAALGAGFEAAHLGPYTLRTETAGPALAAMILFWAGRFA